MTFRRTEFDYLTNEELIMHIANLDDATPLMTLLSERLEEAVDTINALEHDLNLMHKTSEKPHVINT